jgi:hypothetical protein
MELLSTVNQILQVLSQVLSASNKCRIASWHSQGYQVSIPILSGCTLRPPGPSTGKGGSFPPQLMWSLCPAVRRTPSGWCRGSGASPAAGARSGGGRAALLKPRQCWGREGVVSTTHAPAHGYDVMAGECNVCVCGRRECAWSTHLDFWRPGRAQSARRPHFAARNEKFVLQRLATRRSGRRAGTHPAITSARHQRC